MALRVKRTLADSSVESCAEQPVRPQTPVLPTRHPFGIEQLEHNAGVAVARCKVQRGLAIAIPLLQISRQPTSHAHTATLSHPQQLPLPFFRPILGPFTSIYVHLMSILGPTTPNLSEQKGLHTASN